MGAEGFTILAILEANDRISRVLEHVDGSLDRFSSAAARAAETAAVAGERIDASLLQTASGADATELASAKLSGAQAKVAETAKAQADAERAVIEAQTQVTAAADGDTAATERLVAANDALTAAQKRSALAAKEEAAAADHAAAVGRATTLSTTEGRAAADEAAAAQARLAQQQARTAEGSSLLSKGMGMAALGIAAVGFLAVKSAGNFESMTEHLVTDAGESQSQIGLIRSGMLALASATGTTTTQMAAGMYHIESAGFHGQKALDVLRTAAEGAKVGGADLDTIGQALTGTMNAFGKSGGTSTQMMNALIATVGAGDMKLQDLGSSLGNVAAIGASAGLSYAQVGGAIATMTAQNVSAQRATQDLAHTIGSLGNPTAVMTKEMTAMGVDSLSLSSKLGKNGLTGTFDILVKAIAAHTKGGAVMVNTLNASKAAAAQADQVLAQMPPTMEKVAKGWQAGTTSTKDFNTAIHALPPAQQKMYLAFEQLVKKSGSFAQSLQANTPMAQTFNAALAKMTGGTTSLNTILMLSGTHAQTFKDNVKTIGDAAHKTGSSVDNWDKIQGTFNQKLDVAKASLESAGIAIGMTLLPAVSAMAGAVAAVVAPMATWISHNQKIVGLLAAIIGPALAIVGIIKTIAMVTKIWAAAQLMLDAAMDANPIGLIVIAIAALAGGLIYAYDHFKTFRDIVNSVLSFFAGIPSFFEGVWKTVVRIFHEAVTTVVGIVKGWYPLILAVLSGGLLLIPALIFKYWSQISGFVSGIWNDVLGFTTTVWNEISGFFMKWWPLLLVIFMPFIALIMAIWNNFHTQIIGTVVTTWNKVVAFFTGIWSWITKTAQATWNLFKQYVISPVLAVWAEIQGPIHQVEKFLDGVWNNIKSQVQTAWNLIKTYIINPVKSAWNTLVTTFDSIKSTISGKLNEAWTAVKNIGDKFLSIGSAIVQGIINGVTNAGGGLFNSLQNLASGALNAAKNFLGINSPSKVFADHVGMAIPEGIAKGVNDHAHLAHRAVAALSGALVGSAQLAGSGATVAMATAGGGLSAMGAGRPAAGNIYLTVDLRDSRYTNERDINQMVDKIGRLVATKLLPQGGRRIS